MRFKKLKLIECTSSEFETVKKIIEKSSCVAAATSILRTYLVKGLIEWKCETRSVSTVQLQEMAFNAVQAVKNNYKYLKVIDR